MTSLSILSANGPDRVSPVREWVDVVVLVIAAVCGVLIGLQLYQWVSDVPIERGDFQRGTHTHDGRVYFRPSWEIAGAVGYFLAANPIGVFVYGLAVPLAFAGGIVEARDTRRRLGPKVAGTPPRAAASGPVFQLVMKLAVAALIAGVVLALIGSLSLRDVAMISLEKAGVLPPKPHPIYLLGYFIWLGLVSLPVGIFRLGDAFG